VSQVEISQYAPPVPYDFQSLTAAFLLSFVMIDVQDGFGVGFTEGLTDGLTDGFADGLDVGLAVG
jgi:hypothetical protein